MGTPFSEPIWRAWYRRDALIAARRGNKNKIGGHGVFPEEASGFAGALSESYIACASDMVRLVLFSQIPRRRKGIAVAAASNLARRGILDSGSQRKSWADKKNVRAAPTAGEPRPSKKSGRQGAKAPEITVWRPRTR